MLIERFETKYTMSERLPSGDVVSTVSAESYDYGGDRDIELPSEAENAKEWQFSWS
ncbi:MAG: hypothetical protein SWK76_12630 [Actinomycetota bacterium]|nr:hypothetical protein [Actinomycetota bacterium]